MLVVLAQSCFELLWRWLMLVVLCLLGAGVVDVGGFNQ